MTAATHRIHLRLNDADYRIIQAVASKHGLGDTDVVRMALRALAREEGITMRDYETMAQAVYDASNADVPKRERAEYIQRIEDWLRAGDLADNPSIEQLAREWDETEATEDNEPTTECESCAQSGEHVPATTHSHNPNWSGYNLCAECAAEYDSRMPEPAFSGDRRG